MWFEPATARIWGLPSAQAGWPVIPCPGPRTLCPEVIWRGLSRRRPVGTRRRPVDTRHLATPPRRPACAIQLCCAARRLRTTTQIPAYAYLDRSGANVHDPTAGRDPEVDGISTTVHPRSPFRLPSTPGHGREPATPLSLHAVARRRAGLPVWDDFPCPDVLSRFAPTASDESLRGCRGRTHHELPARRARNVLSSSTPLTADPALLEGRPPRGGLVRARIQPRAGIQRRRLRSASTSCVAYAGATFAFVLTTLSPPWPARPHGLLCKVHTTDPDAIVSACLLPREPVGMLTVAALQVFAALSARDQCSGMCMSMAAICQPRSLGPRQKHLPIPARKLRAR